jgi:hypothetical protein
MPPVLAGTAARGGGMAGATRGEGRVREDEERKTRVRERNEGRASFAFDRLGLLGQFSRTKLATVHFIQTVLNLF